MAARRSGADQFKPGVLLSLDERWDNVFWFFVSGPTFSARPPLGLDCDRGWRNTPVAGRGIWVGAVVAGEMMVEDFRGQPETRWRFFADTVMGGASSGQVAFLSEGGQSFARMTGRVSTQNNGGFIQMQLELSAPPPDRACGVRLILRGNDQRYFVHLRTSATVLPWQYYRAGFDAGSAWTELRLPFSDFAPSGALLRDGLRAGSLRSIAIVAYGRDHDAAIDVREVGFY